MAFAVTTDFDVRSTGSDANGGGFDTAATGTDFSLQDAAQQAYTDIVIDGTTNTKITSAAHPFDSTSPGNIINITAGTGFTVQRVQVVSVAAGVATCDKAVGTVGSTGGTGNLGGGLLTLGQAAAVKVAGNRVYIKYHATNTYGTTTTTQNIAGGPINDTQGMTSGRTAMWQGYETTHGDLSANRPTLLNNQSTNDLFIINSTGGVLDNVIINGNSKAVRGLVVKGTGSCGKRIKMINCGAADGLRVETGCFLYGCEIASGGGASTNGFSVGGSGGGMLYCCTVRGMSANSTGIRIVSGGAVVAYCEVYGTASISGGTGIFCDAAAGSGGIVVMSCSVSNWATSGIMLQTGSSKNTLLLNNVCYGNGTDIDTNNANANAAQLIRNFYGSINSAFNTLAGGLESNVALSGTPFTNVAGDDLTLNNTTGAGASVRAAAFPATFPGTGSSNGRDGGALQHL